MITIQFNDPHEFIEELLKWRQGNTISDRLIRLTTLSEVSKTVAPLRHVSVVATALVKADESPQLLRLDRFVGDLWTPPGDDETGQATSAKAQEMTTVLEHDIKGMGLEIRAGLFEE